MQQASQEQISLPEHLESYLGTIHRGWQDTATDSGIQVVSFANQPEEGVTTFVTLGLSRSILNLGDIYTIREELITSASNALSPDSVAGFLLSVAEDLQRSKRALLRGEVLGPGQPVTSEATLTAVYVANPSPFHPALTDFRSEPPAIIFAYLIPISGQEASLIQSHGWRWFEAELENQNPDVWDWARTTDVVCGH
jgi:hypothetical protein